MSEIVPGVPALLSSHPRTFHANKFVYPVLSRRSQGISIGINLNPDKVCNFDCIYCQVDRRSDAETKFVEIEPLQAELEQTLDVVLSGALYQDERFQSVPAPWRRLNDLAFSGDGEPTTYRNFDHIVEQVAGIKQRRGLHGVKLVLITNASMFHRREVQRALKVLDAHQGEIWAKLEAGTEAYFRRVDRTTIPFRRILENITTAAQQRPLVIQSLFMRVEGQPPSPEELEAYYQRLKEIVAAGGSIQLVQVYTVARPPAESYVTALPSADLEAIATRIRSDLGIPAEWYPGAIR